MKKNLLLSIAVVGCSLLSAKTNAQYIDLSTGMPVSLIKHVGNGMMYNTETSRPVYLYINVATNDTFYGRTGANVNGKLMRNQQGRFVYNDDMYVYTNGDYVLKTDDNNYERKIFDRDGDVILKGENGKKKRELDGDIKRKDGEAKLKIEGDGVLKDKDGTYKRKIDGEGNILEKDSTYKNKLNVDGSIKMKDKETQTKVKVKD